MLMEGVSCPLLPSVRPRCDLHSEIISNAGEVRHASAVHLPENAEGRFAEQRSQPT